MSCIWCGAVAQQQYFQTSNTLSGISSQRTSFDGHRTLYKIPGERMKKWGTTMTVLGGGLIIGGIVVASSADPDYYVYNSYTGTYDTTDPKVALGVVMIIYGVGLTVPGVILWVKGTKKYNQYFEQQRNLSLNMTRTGVTLRYRF